MAKQLAQTFARQGIETHVIGPTNTRGQRVKATGASGHTLTPAWDDGLSAFGNARAAALALAAKLGWQGPWIGGSTQAGHVS